MENTSKCMTGIVSTACALFLILGSVARAQVAGEVCIDRDSLGPPLPGDFDHDGDRDLKDFEEGMLPCLTGSGVPHLLGCSLLDFDSNGVVDLRDVAGFQIAFTGELHPMAPAVPLDAACPMAGSTINTHTPSFSWLPFPAPDIGYRLSIFKIPQNPALREDPLAGVPPYFVAETLGESFLSYPAGVSPLLGGSDYLWQVEVFNLLDPDVILFSGTAAPVKVAAPSPLEELQELLKHLEEIRKQLEDATGEVEDNPLVEEVRLIDSIAKILSNLGDLDEDALAALQAFLECDSEAMSNLSPEVLDKVLAVLEGMIRLFIIANDDLSQAQKDTLKSVADTIAQVRSGLKSLADIKAILGTDEWNPLEYLAGAIEDKIQEVIEDAAKKALAKLVGAKAAGAIFSILKDLADLVDLLLLLDTIEGLKKAWNLMMLEVIKAADGMPAYKIDGSKPLTDKYFFLNPWSDAKDGSITLTPELKCWKPTEGGAPGEGTWESENVTFTNAGSPSYGDAEGDTSITFPVNSMKQSKTGDPPKETTTCRYDISLKFPAPSDKKGGLPCYLTLTAVIKDSNGDPLGSITVFVGVITE